MQEIEIIGILKVKSKKVESETGLWVYLGYDMPRICYKIDLVVANHIILNGAIQNDLFNILYRNTDLWFAYVTDPTPLLYITWLFTQQIEHV